MHTYNYSKLNMFPYSKLQYAEYVYILKKYVKKRMHQPIINDNYY